MKIKLLRNTAIFISMVGTAVRIRTVYHFFTGALALEINPAWKTVFPYPLYALALKLPVPLHVISIGLIIQKKYLSPVWVRIAWYAIVISGTWLGIALAVKLMLK